MFREPIRSASTKTFALRLSYHDLILEALFILAFSIFNYTCSEAPVMWQRLVLTGMTAVSIGSFYLIIRSLVPFVMRLSFANMVRLCVPFYFWIVAIILSVGISFPIRAVYSTINTASVQLTLMLATIALTIRFFQTGSLTCLTLAYCASGASTGMSALGVLAPATLITLMVAMSNRLLQADDAWEDELPEKMVDYFQNPLVSARIKWIFMLCFVACCGAMLALMIKMHDLSGLGNICAHWFRALSLDGIVVFLVTATLPLILTLRLVGTASDTSTLPSFAEMLVYITIIPLSALFILKPEWIKAHLGMHMEIDSRLLALAYLTYSYNLLLSAIVLLVDIRCRDFRNVEGINVGILRGTMHFSFILASIIAPFMLMAFAGFMFCRKEPQVVHSAVQIIEKAATAE